MYPPDIRRNFLFRVDECPNDPYKTEDSGCGCGKKYCKKSNRRGKYKCRNYDECYFANY